MTHEWVLEVSCDAPGCTNHVQVRSAQESRNPPLPEPWDTREVDGHEVMGCCQRHLAAAMLHVLGFEAEAADLAAPEKRCDVGAGG